MVSLSRLLYIKWRFRYKYGQSSANIKEYESLRDKKKCLVMLAADYGNLGDVAITYAQERWLKEHYPDYEIVDVPISRTLSSLKALQKVCSQEDIITIVGGGNMSDLYFDIELLRQMVVKAFNNNRVISFPQTMFFSDTHSGRYLKWRARRIYTRHKRLTIAAREQQSFELMQGIKLNPIMVPDIVMTLDKRLQATQRKGITWCLRQDAESSLSKEFKDELIHDLQKDYQITLYDTHIGRGKLTLAEREEELNKIWQQFRSSEWVITDRLHGMIFAFITGTPCLVFPNNNHKIEGCYEWIKDCGYIHFVHGYDRDRVIDILHTKATCHFENTSAKIQRKVDVLYKV